MHHEVLRFGDLDAVAVAAADYVATCARGAVAAHGTCAIALSGGNTPRPMFAALRSCDVPWDRTVIYQVDERVVGPRDDARNLNALRDELATVPARVEPMPVDELDLDHAARRYEALLPERFDLVHLGLGPDGHTASLVPRDVGLTVIDRLVTVTGVYQGYRRMTLTYPALARADQLLRIVTGRDKARPLSQLLENDPTIPASHVVASRSLVMADLEAAGVDVASPEER